MIQHYKQFCSIIFFTCSLIAHGQVVEPNLQNASQWKLINRSIKYNNDDGRKQVVFNEVPDNGLMILKETDFSNGTIELDIKGSDKFQQSFVGFAFHGKNDTTYDAVYFRPFNFKSTDPVRLSHAVQYISAPENEWEKLRTEFPGKYESKIIAAPDPNEWFHVKITLDGQYVAVFVNNASNACLKIDKLNNRHEGFVALWLGNNVGGNFASLKIYKKETANNQQAQLSVPYGNNVAAGHYFTVSDAKLYYEIYGQGKPLVLLHGGVYGYIDEFEPFIEKLSLNYKVICIGTRGHGKSAIGHTPFTYNQRADDAYQVIRSITSDSVIVLGFSDGGYGALKLAALHPEMVKKLIAIGAGDYPINSINRNERYTPQSLLKTDSAFFTDRLKLMPEPARWGEFLSMINKMYNEDFVSTETFGKIKCPTLIMAGDRDDYNSREAVLKCAKSISNAQLSIIPGCNHVVFYCNFPAVWASVQPFLN